ncbi:MAG: sulfite exporter TauE/SafE family protein [Solirubrobacteraceae bacterium]|nr:sulfite exporter TauE/SafE family protein [Solirubrobacteraceae bacterium]
MIEAVLIGVLAGVIAGMLGVGGGSLFVPALTLFVGLGQVEAEATSLLAIVPVALVGTWRQRGYGNVRDRDALLLGVLAIAGAVGGVVVANAVPERALELGFAALLVYVAAHLARDALRTPQAPTGDTPAR